MAGIENISTMAANELYTTNSRLRTLRDTAGKAVGSAFYGTIFQMMRQSPFKTDIGHGGRGEEVFSAQLHGIFAERMGECRNHNLSDVLYRRLEKQQRLIDQTRVKAGGL